jgi:hypothetical protein
MVVHYEEDPHKKQEKLPGGKKELAEHGNTKYVQ